MTISSCCNKKKKKIGARVETSGSATRKPTRVERGRSSKGVNERVSKIEGDKVGGESESEERKKKEKERMSSTRMPVGKRLIKINKRRKRIYTHSLSSFVYVLYPPPFSLIFSLYARPLINPCHRIYTVQVKCVYD